jgi:hypothetical protein
MDELRKQNTHCWKPELGNMKVIPESGKSVSMTSEVIVQWISELNIESILKRY